MSKNMQLKIYAYLQNMYILDKNMYIRNIFASRMKEKMCAFKNANSSIKQASGG